MTCPGCGFEQREGDRCRQCGTPLGAPAADRTSSSRTAPIEEPLAPPAAPAPPPPPAPPRKDKHRARPLHDLDLTIEGMSVDSSVAAAAAPELAPAAKPLPRTTAGAIDGRRGAALLDVVIGAALAPAGAAGGDHAVREAHAAALAKLDGAARALGADAVIGVALALTAGPQGLWLCYTGTAVKLERQA